MYKEIPNFKKLVQIRLKCKAQLRDFLVELNRRWYDVFDNRLKHSHLCRCLTTYKPFKDKGNFHVNICDLDLLIHQNNNGHCMNYYFIMDELTDILKKSKSQSTIELTNIHYAEMLLPYLKHYHLRSVWQKFISRSPKRQILEEAITLMAQWFQPMEDISYSQIETKLDNITQQVIERLKIKWPFHPILSASHEQFSYWKCNNINENQWDDKDAKQALDILCEVLVELEFLLGGYPMNLYSYLDYHLINLVLDTKHGCQVMLKIILQSVARRLGIHCDLRSHLKTYSHDCVLFWKPKSGIRNCNDTCFEITLQQGKIILIENSVEIIESLQPINLVLFLLKWVKYIPKHTFHDVTGFTLIFWLREFQMLMKPDLKVIKRLVKHYFYQKKDPSIFISPLRKMKYSSDLSTMVQVMTILIDIQWNKYSLALFREEHKYVCKPKKRNANIKFAVGMIVEVRPQGFTGVIVEWEQKNLDRLDIPTSNIYTVLADNKLHYVSEECLEKMNKPIFMRNNLIGKYFCEFKNTYYMPNEMLANEYPDDVLYLSNELQ